MIKDPQQKEETPYEVLNLPPDSSKKIINGALPRIMRDPKRRRRIPEAQRARKALLDPNKRMTVDALHYNVGAIDPSQIEVNDVIELTRQMGKIPQLTDDELPMTLKLDDQKTDHTILNIEELPVSINVKYDDQDRQPGGYTLIPVDY